MTSFINIRVNAWADRARAVLAKVRRDVHQTNAAVAAGNAQDPLGRRHLTSMMKFGNQLQWTGRMIQYNFTLPLAIAAGAATKWALENEKAMVHVEKVYGDVSDAAKQFRRENENLTQQMAENKAARIFAAELDALREAFIAISNYYGVAQKEVLEVAGAWAAAGASGVDLAKSVDATMQAIIIGDMNAAAATKALISIQAQYNLNSEELMDTLAELNSVENATGASMQDLIVAYEKSAGVARSAGIETKQLAAYVAAIVPAAGSASTGGNALKTIFSRLLSPTKETVQVLEAMGLSMDDMGWKSATVAEQLQLMSDKFLDLSSKQKNVVSSVAASRWQVNRFDILMKELNNDIGFYAKALDAADDSGDNFRRMQHELNTVLESDPRRLQRMWVMLQNASADIIQPLIPYIIYLAQTVAQLATAFSNLDPELQKLILFGLTFLAVIGPVVRYLGALGTLFGVVGFAARHSVKGVFSLLGMLNIFGSVIDDNGDKTKRWGGRILDSVRKVGTYFMTGLSSVIAFLVTKFPLMLLSWSKTIIAMGVATANFVAYLKMLFIMAALSTSSIWGGMWLILKTMALRGLAGLAASSAIAPIVLVFTKLRGLIILIWAGQWAALKAAAVIAWAQLKALSIVGSAMQVGIFAKMRAAVVIIFTTMFAAVRGLMISFALTSALLGAAAAGGFINGIKKIGPFLLKWGKFLVSWPALAALAILGVMYAFRDELTQIWNNIVEYFEQADITRIFQRMGDGIMQVFNSLPRGIQNAMIAVVTVVRDAALAVYEWFSYINPFARHSPSLVDNVNRGVDTINAKFQQLGKTRGIIASVYAEIKKFSNATRGLNLSSNQLEIKEDRKAIKSAGGGGAALASYNRLQAMLRKLNPLLAQTEAKLNAQEAVVDRWQKKLDKANAELEKQQEILGRLQDKLSKWQDKLDEANSRLDYFANAPLKGMREMEDQIFANTMAQTRLRYEMMQMEKVVGTFEDLEEKISAINGLQEILRGTQTDLRAAGAGSEILSQYDAEIKKLEEQKGTYSDTFDQLNTMRLELEKLQMQAEELDLVKALKFDELQYQIDRTADQTKELSFDEIIGGIQTAQVDIAKYTEKVEDATKAVRDQEGVVNEAEKARDRIQNRLEAEELVLGRIRDRYDAIRDAVDAINRSIQDVVANAEKMNAELDKKKKDAEAAKKKKSAAEGYMSPGLENFLAAEGANYPDPGGSGMPPRDDWSSQVKDIEDWTKKLGERTAEMFANVNPFKSIKAKAIEAWDWVVDKAVGAKDEIVSAFGQIFADVDFGETLGDIQSKIEPVLEFFTDVAKEIGGFLGAAWDLVGPDIKRIGRDIWNGLKDIWERVGPELEGFAIGWENIGTAIKNAWNIVIKPILGIMAGAILAVIEVVLSIVSELIDPVFDLIGDLITGIIKIVRGIMKVLVGIFTADLDMILSGVADIFSGLWSIIWGIFKAGVRLIWNVVEGFVQGVIDFFVWLWDELVGHSIVPDIINGILDWFGKLGDLATWIWDNVLVPIYDFFVDAKDDVIDSVSGWWKDIKDGWKNIKDNVKQWWKDNVWEPVRDGIYTWWANRTSDFKGWWADIKKAWDNITSRQWWLDNVWTPIKNGVETWWGNRLSDFSGWWADIKAAWNNITSRQWWFDNVWTPIKNGVETWWGNRLSDFSGWWEGLKGAWDNIKTSIGGWWERNVTNPIFDKVTGVFSSIQTWFEQRPNILKNAMKSIVNSVIDGVNTIIRGLNKVADVLPGNLWDIDTIPPWLAAGGIPNRKGNRGFVTNGARAIVGEGKANWPEFVIPTDPTHRNRAKSLLAMAAQKMGIADAAASVRNATTTDGHGVPMFGIGGWLSDKWEDTKNLGKKIANLPRRAVANVMDAVLDQAAKLINRIGYQPLESPPEMAIGKMRSWVRDFDGAIDKKLDSMVPAGGSVPVADPSSPGAQQWWGGGLFTRRFVAHMEKAEELAGSGVHVYQGGFRPATPYSGTSHQGDAVDFQVNNALIRAFRQVGIAAGDRTGLGDWVAHTHAIPGPSAGSAAGSAVWQWQDYVARGGASQSLRSPWGLKYGAIVRRGANAEVTLGDGRYDEAVVPLPHGWQNLREPAGAGRTIIINGDLSFPNIKNGDDAELFVQNLENIARD